MRTHAISHPAPEPDGSGAVALSGPPGLTPDGAISVDCPVCAAHAGQQCYYQLGSWPPRIVRTALAHWGRRQLAAQQLGMP